VEVGVMELTARSSFRLLDWDSAHFGINIGQVLPVNGDEELFNDALTWADRLSLDCMYLLVDSTDPTTVRRAAEFGWRVVDVRLTLGIELPRAATSRRAIRLANPGDIPQLKRLAISSHKDSRFYADGNFRAAACEELFSIWIERSVLDRDFAGAVFVAEVEGNQPAAYVTCTMKQGAGKIGLIAVDQKMHRKGVGTSLLAEAARWFSEQGCTKVSIVTQGCNVPALRMYERFGFKIESIELWFHWWRKQYSKPKT
jgi:dTDP-4-amino-4,6-dideoxy-D-galactose acyltransferase